MPFIIAMDYDETITTGDSKKIYPGNQKVISKIKEFQRHGAEVILWTCREEKRLEEAVKRCKEEFGLEFAAINENSPFEKGYLQEEKKKGNIFALRKIYADLYVDDKALGSIEHFLAIDVEKTCKNFENR